ncbi:hypothetical protein T492DRAFT_172203 [Pavlovales sp. CCMP2436]|nr:hypothetical protein T492DRAFT_172203 [Pavlovales sp. CCMP2436]
MWRCVGRERCPPSAGHEARSGAQKGSGGRQRNGRRERERERARATAEAQRSRDDLLPEDGPPGPPGLALVSGPPSAKRALKWGELSSPKKLRMDEGERPRPSEIAGESAAAKSGRAAGEASMLCICAGVTLPAPSAPSAPRAPGTVSRSCVARSVAPAGRFSRSELRLRVSEGGPLLQTGEDVSSPTPTPIRGGRWQGRFASGSGSAAGAGAGAGHLLGPAAPTACSSSSRLRPRAVEREGVSRSLIVISSPPGVSSPRPEPSGCICSMSTSACADGVRPALAEGGPIGALPRAEGLLEDKVNVT